LLVLSSEQRRIQFSFAESPGALDKSANNHFGGLKFSKEK
jgi:hypothetical protein